MNRLPILLVLVLLTVNSSILHAYDPQTHREIGERAADSAISSLDRVLRNELGFSRGFLERFLGRSLPRSRTVQELIGDGAFFEDVPDQRSLNHFHNPLVEPWDAAGLRSSFLGLPVRGQSSVLWQQNPAQNSTFVFTPVPLPSFGGNWSWQDARQRYLEALTNPTKQDTENQKGRDTAFAELFETLGRLTHLIQDASVPAHVRNDPHPRFLRNPDWYEDWVEETRSTNLDLFRGLLEGGPTGPMRPPGSIFTATGDPQAPIPIARLIDTDKFRLELGNVGVTTSDPAIGISEYTNGNFLSRDTRFVNFAFPRTQSLDPNSALLREGAGFRRYFHKRADGEAVDFFVTEGVLHKDLRAALGTPPSAGGWFLDERVHQSYAAKLLPRAVGYSGALLDYFFRGKLDVDVVPDSADSSAVKLVGTYVGTDGFSDSLEGGTLKLYADNPDGVRTEATALGSTSVGRIEPGQALESAQFLVPDNAERFVAVYKGKLGNEVPLPNPDPKLDFPGGVIGKVLGGVRVEEVFPDSTRWFLRTPQGVFPLPILLSEAFNLKWGDADNTLFSLGPSPDGLLQVLAYQIARPAGSPEIPLRTEPDGRRVVDVRVLKRVPFPVDMDLGTTVHFTQTVHVTQQLLKFTVTNVLEWQQEAGTTDPTRGFYKLVRQDVTPLEVNPVLNETHTFTQSFPLRLNRGSAIEYFWFLENLALDPSGRVLALIGVTLLSPQPQEPVPALPLFGLNQDGTLRVLDQFGVNVFFPPPVSEGLLHAVVDLERRQVIGSTAEPVITITSEAATDRTFTPFPGVVWVNATTVRAGGPDAGTFNSGWFPVSLRPQDQTTPDEITEVRTRSGLLGVSADGWHRGDLTAELARVGLSTFQMSLRDAFQEVLIYFCGSVTSCKGIRKIDATGHFDTTPPAFFMASRARPAPGVERVVLLGAFRAGSFLGEFPKTGPLLVWDPEAHQARTLRARFTERFAGLHAATGTTAVLVTPGTAPGSVTTSLFPLDASREPTVFVDTFLAFPFTLVHPSFLYNVMDLKFYRPRPPLQRTALPARLAPVPIGTEVLALFGDFHAIKLP